MVTASDMQMHHVLIIFIEGYTDVNHESNTFFVISETIHTMPIMFAVKIVSLKVYMTIASPMTLTFNSRSQMRLTLLFNLQYLEQYLSYYVQTWHDGKLIHGIYAHARFDDLDLDAKS